MVISIFFLLALLAVASFAVPGLGPFGALLLLFLLAAGVWWIGLAATTRGAPREALARVKRAELLGPGGPDDPFANEPYEDEQAGRGL
jgi:hypothetical protein